MANGLGNLNPLQILGTDGILYAGSFQTNGTSDPATTTFRTSPGLTFTVVYSATGVYTVTLPADLNLPDLPLSIKATPQYSALANWFEVGIVGEYNRTTRVFVIQAHRSGTGNAPSNTAGNRINFEIVFRNSTGR